MAKSKDKQAARAAFYDGNGTDYSATMSFEQFFKTVWPNMNKAEGGVTLDFEEAMVLADNFLD